MIEITQTDEFAAWYESLGDRHALARIDARIFRLAHGNAGDVKPVGEGVSELRIDYGPGYRIYYCRTGERVLLLLIGGDKRTQSKDIERALELARKIKRKTNDKN